MFDANNILDVLSKKSPKKKSLIAGMQNIFSEVIVLQQDGPDTLPSNMVDNKYCGIALDLWIDHQPYATAICHNYGSGSIRLIQESYTEEGTQFSLAAQRDIKDKMTRRIICTFEYWNPETEIRKFITQATDWFENHIGPVEREDGTSTLEFLTSVNHKLRSEGGLWAMSTALLADGDEAHVIMAIAIEVHPKNNLRSFLGRIFKR
ncbi:hypothetical protein [Profundibacter sp.]